MLEVPLLGVGAVLRFEKNVSSMAKMTKARATSEYAPPPSNEVIQCCHPSARAYAQGAKAPSHEWLLIEGCRTLFTRTPHGASRLVNAMSAWSVETRRAPFRHCRGTVLRIAAMRDTMIPPPRAPPLHYTSIYINS